MNRRSVPLPPIEIGKPFTAALSSDTPVQVAPGLWEVLRHTPESVDLGRFEPNGLPVLQYHDHTLPVGNACNPRLAGGKLRADVTLADTPAAREVVVMAPGVPLSLSIGYEVLEYEDVKRADGSILRTVKGWQPVEVSIVLVPADATVGIGRSATPSAFSPPSPSSLMIDTPNDPTPPEPSREARILDMADAAGLSARETRELIDSGKSYREISDLLIRRKAGTVSFVPAPPSRDYHTPDETPFADAIFRPDSEAVQRRTKEESSRLGMRTRGNLVRLRISPHGTRSAMTTTSAAALVPTVQGELIDVMSSRSVAMKAGARPYQIENGTLSLTRQTSRLPAGWSSENPAAAVAASLMEFEPMLLAAKRLTAAATYSVEMQRLSMPYIEEVVREDIAGQFATALDAATLAGPTGGHNPVGILFTPNVNVVPIGADGGAPSLDALVEMEEALDSYNATDRPLTFATTPGMRGILRRTLDFDAAAGRPIWRDDNTVLGYPAVSTNNLPSDLTKGTSDDCHAAILGDFTQVVIGMWGAVEIIVDPYTDARKGLVHVTAHLLVDVGIRQPRAFSVVRDFTRA